MTAHVLWKGYRKERRSREREAGEREMAVLELEAKTQIMKRWELFTLAGVL